MTTRTASRALQAILVVMTCLGAAPEGASGQTRPQPGAVEIPASATTIEGLPTVRVEASQDGAIRRVLGASEASKERLTISVVDGQYFWTSRGNSPLQLVTSGEFTYLSSSPGQYVRLTRLADTISYVEHVERESGSVTWWGEITIAVGK